ncbi:MAG: 23S rRNA (uracil(1939)-C(5))-methyltransferase RlmD [Coriobacteriia bacterium]|nr:23S rRNA (uracil(1939)-C(5))-methyltransferase RlmD [Coriobacteriia bacterium]
MPTTLQLERMSSNAGAVGHLPSGKTVFVEGGAPGDVAEIEITEEKSSFANAKVVQVVEAGPDRIAPACPYGAACGGCPWQHLAYEAQLAAKRSTVVEALVRTGGVPKEQAEELVAPVMGSKRQWGYRNKLELGCGRDAAGRLEVGLRAEGTHNLFTPQKCLLAHAPIQKAAKSLRGALRHLQGNDDLGIYRIGVRNSLRTKDTEIALWTPPSAFPRAAATAILRDALRNTSVVRVLAAPDGARKVKRVEQLNGKGCWGETLCDVDFLTSAPAFFQVNTAQAEKLVETVIDGLKLEEGELVADLYSGGGTFSVPLALEGAQVVAVESVGASVRDLRRNAERAGVWIDVLGGDAERELPTLGRLDALVVDPPRAGLAKGMAESIAAAHPHRMAYVSCNPQTLARDIARLREVGLQLQHVQPVDLFPQTYHVECVALLHQS